MPRATRPIRARPRRTTRASSRCCRGARRNSRPASGHPFREPDAAHGVAIRDRERVITYFRSLTAAGFAATAISYGPARMGFGLYVPEFREAFSMSTTLVGVISSLGFSGFFLGLLIAQWLLTRRGPEFPVLSGLVAATLGLVIVAAAPNAVVLAIGVTVAAMSAGFAWTPFNDAVHRKIRDYDRPEALSEISTGTSLGIAGAGLAALVMGLTGLEWRTCWIIFAVLAALGIVLNWAALRDVEKAPGTMPDDGWRDLIQWDAAPLFAIAFVFGTLSAVFLAFTADHMASAGDLPGLPQATIPAAVFILYGIGGLSGLATGRAETLLGLPWLIRLVMLCGAVSLVLPALAAGTWAGLVLASLLQGVHVMMISAILAFWSERVFPDLPSLSFTATLLASATGSILGPVIAGLVSESLGASTMFLGTAALPLAAALLLRARHAASQPAHVDSERWH